ncbi:hypothetical protein RN001_002656 [Aquatica leii]|uniref:PHD-type domain-containing protein n=1 Tax=Aquatica leii TaxID=1421715 RepID=A0AAN7QB76_9COLE|nr:hypothetical protein RN001_002656 [Aquatica leii]
MIIAPSSRIVQDRRAYVVFWFGDSTISKVLASNILPFAANYRVVYDSAAYRKPWLIAVNATVHELLGKTGIKKKELHKWAYSNILHLSERINEIPQWIKNVLSKNKTSFENLATVTIEELMSCNTPIPCITRLEPSSDQQKFLDKCKTKKAGLYGYCLSCYSSHVEEEHPFFVGHLCIPCLEDFKSVINHKKTFTSLRYCAVCADTVNASIVCPNELCSKAYCKKCIKYLSKAATMEDLLKNKRFRCFLCTNQINKTKFGMLTPRLDFKNKVRNLFENNSYLLVNYPVLGKPITVLSIDDLQRIGLKALKELNIPIQMYYVVNSFSTNLNDSEVRNLGNYKEITAKVLESIGPIHLVIIGTRSICDSKNIRIGGFYDFFRIINLIKSCCCQEFFWFFEAPALLDINWKIIADRFLQCKPIKLNGPEKRLFWGNLLTLSNTKYMSFRNKYGSTNSDTSSDSEPVRVSSGNYGFLSAEELFLIHNNQWDLEFFKSLLGFLSDFYNE